MYNVLHKQNLKLKMKCHKNQNVVRREDVLLKFNLVVFNVINEFKKKTCFNVSS